MTPPDPQRLIQVLQRILGQARALPEDWEPEATTYDLPRFHSEAEFAARFRRVAEQILDQDVRDPEALRALLYECGHPYDYARLGHPLSTVYELYMQARSGAARAVSFASRTKPFLAAIEAATAAHGTPGAVPAVRLYAAERLPLSEEGKQTLRRKGVEIHEGWQGPLPAAPPGTALTLYVSQGPYSDDLMQRPADGICYALPHGGVLLIKRPEAIDAKHIQLIRKRTVAALLAADAKAELRRLAGLAEVPTAVATEQECDARLVALFPQVRECVYFCTGLAAEAAVFSAAARVLTESTPSAAPMKLFYAENGYGGTGQLIAEILPAQVGIEPAPLPVLGHDAAGRPVTLIDRFLDALPGLGGAPACLFLETPTNPELQVHDFPRLMAALRAHAARHGSQIPVLVDTTLAPLYPLFAQEFARGWPFLLVKSGSKYFTRGKATLGVACSGADPLARRILERARKGGSDAGALAKPSQLAALAAGLSDLRPRMERIAAHTRRLAELIRAALARHGRQVTLYTMSDEQLAAGLQSGILSFYLPPAPTSHADLVDEFVDYLLAHAPAIVKNRVSYGQSSGGGRPDVFYVINPEESTQGSLPEAVKASQKKDNVQICRISVPEHGDVEALGRAIAAFCDRKYA
jgi:cystathionine beta-lyase/cystathionine gamma-synthase